MLFYVGPLGVVVFDLALEGYACHEVLLLQKSAVVSPPSHATQRSQRPITQDELTKRRLGKEFKSRTQVFANVLNRNWRSSAVPSLVKAQRPESSNEVNLGDTFAASVPAENRGCGVMVTEDDEKWRARGAIRDG